MKDKVIMGIKKVENLNLTLEEVGKDLQDAIMNNKKNKKILLSKYRYLEEKINEENKKIEELKRQQEEKEQEKIRKEQEEYEELEAEGERIRQEVIDRKNEELELLKNKCSKINEKLTKLEYNRESAIQRLNILSAKYTETEERFNNAKQSGSVEELISADEDLQEIKNQIEKADKELKKHNARLSMGILIKMVVNESQLKKMKEIIEDYNDMAEEYELEKVDVEEYTKKYTIDNQIRKVRKEAQRIYRMEEHKEDEDKLIIGLTNKGREKIGKEYKERMKEKKENSFLAKTGRVAKTGIKAIGKGIAIVGVGIATVAVSAGKFVGRNAKNLWDRIRYGANEGLSGANKVMISGATKLKEKLEKDESVYEERRNQLKENIKSDVDNEKAVKASEETVIVVEEAENVINK